MAAGPAGAVAGVPAGGDRFSPVALSSRARVRSCRAKLLWFTPCPAGQGPG